MRKIFVMWVSPRNVWGGLRVRKAIFCVGVLVGLSSLPSWAQGGCLEDNGADRDDWGFTEFSFKNSCGGGVTVSVCAKYWPPSSDVAVFNIHSGTIYPPSGSLTGGKWEQFDSYQWSEGSTVTCPF
jgi:hypothetical protein